MRRGLDARTLFVLCMIAVSSGLLGLAMLTTGHDWGDDFAAYIMQARSLANGSVPEYIRQSTFTIRTSSELFGPIVYPWGFPLLLVPVYAAFGVNMLAFKMVLTICYVGFLAAFFFIARSRLNSGQSLLLTAFLAFNLALLRAQNRIVSDLPFLVLSTAGLWLIDHYSRSDPGSATAVRDSIGIGLLTFLAATTRFNGVLLLVPLALAQFIHVRRLRRTKERAPQQLVFEMAIPYVLFGLCYGAQVLLLPNSGVGFIDQFRTLSWQSVWGNIGYYLALTAVFLQASFSSAVGGALLYAILLPFFAFALLQHWRRELPLLLYGLATLAVFVLFPPVEGPRYIYPILPLFFLFSFQGMVLAADKLASAGQRAARTATYALWAGLTVFSLATSAINARGNLLNGRQDLTGPFSPASVRMFSFVRDQTPAQSVVIFWKARAMRLFSNRASFVTLNCEDLPKANYVVIVKRGGAHDQISPGTIETCNPAVSLTKVFDNGTYEIYKILGTG